jgi:hypothetical protein
MRFVFCTTCKGRLQHLEVTLPQNLKDNSDYPDAKFLLLDYNSPDGLHDYVRRAHRDDIDSGRLVTYRYSGTGPFNMAHAKNMAHRLGIMEGADVLVNLDADNFTQPGFAEWIAKTIQPDSFLWARGNEPDTPAHDRVAKGCSGRIAVTPSAFLRVGGYDEEKFACWGPDDKDFNFRLRRLGLDRIEIPRQYLGAVLHTDRMRFREYPHAKDEDYGDPFDYNRPPIANYGKFGMGVVYRNFDPNPIELGPVPTRIFGIGMHKTATTSLHEALKVLGLPSDHWRSVRWAKRIWDEVRGLGDSSTVGRSYALSDLPMALLYKQLDGAYPGSKFILTVRDEARWLKSVRAHWSEANPYLSTWESAGRFGHRLHAALYGQETFDAEVFVARYRRHNAEVREYFKDRPGDLLVMDMEKGAGWLELCGFLRMPIPDAPYPMAFVTPPVT